ncbi:UPF0149 family protein [Rhodobacterales bacterium HKCCSP123]|nr:UPF0149 family protein [Rhodobacterales bacterium HKCCSP123]
MLSLDDLDAYLTSDDAPGNCMMISDLDGFLHGIACSPVLIPADEWVMVALGDPVQDVPDEVIEAIIMRYQDISRGLSSEPPMVEPIFWQGREGHVIAMDWCEGFMQAVSLRPKQWLRLRESGQHGELMMPIMLHLVDDHGDSVMGIPQEELDQTLDKAADAIPSAIVSIHRVWQSLDQSAG